VSASGAPEKVQGFGEPETPEPGVDVSATQQAAVFPAVRLELDAVYRAYADTVARWVHRLGGPGVDLEDCVHDVFLVVQSRLSRFRGEAKITTWLYRITHNVTRNQRRKLRFRRWLRGTPHEAAGDQPEPGPSAAEALESAQRRKALYAVLDRMSDKYRTAFILFELEQLSGAEVARLMGARPETVWVWLHRARAEFRKRAEEMRGTLT
jgi:RNA polymerase sigma-70 factor (ECF subfamily)